MNYELESQLRNEARHLHARGVFTWASRLQSAGLDPYRWSDGTPTGIPQPAASDVRRFGAAVMMHRAAPLSAGSYDAHDHTIEVCWTTGAAVLRDNWDYGTVNEILDLDGAKLDRLNSGAPFLNSHQSGTLGMVLGSVVPGSAQIKGGRGLARIALSHAAENAGLVGDIRTGRIRSCSVGYLIHASRVETVRGSDVPNMIVTSWTPIEISAVAIPADPSAAIH